MKYKVKSLSVLLAPALLVWTAAVWAQTAPQFVWQGVLRNPAGAPISDAKVGLTSTAARAEAITGADGQFRLPAVPAGQYRLSVESTGRKFDYAQAIDLDGVSAAVAVTLSNRGELTVTALRGRHGRRAALQPGRQRAAAQQARLQLLLLLAAGTMTDANGATNFTAAVRHQRPARRGSHLRHGRRRHQRSGDGRIHLFQLQRGCGREHRLQLRLDAGRDWPRRCRFHQHHTRSGASGFHGSVFEFVRNSAFRRAQLLRPPYTRLSRPHPAFPPQRVRLHQRRPGLYPPGSTTAAKRTFYFVEYQGFRQVLGTTQVMPVPTPAERSRH
jgi:hypothetical protein